MRISDWSSDVCSSDLHPLFGPMFEKAVARGRYVEIGLKFLVDVDEAGRHADAGPDRKAQSMRLAGAVIRILPLVSDEDGLARRPVQRAEPLGPAREDEEDPPPPPHQAVHGARHTRA